MQRAKVHEKVEWSQVSYTLIYQEWICQY